MAEQGNVVEFRRRRPRAHRQFDRAEYDLAARRQSEDRRRTRDPIPARITLALDSCGLSGDQVDRDLGVWSPPEGWSGPVWDPGTAVDRWEDGTLVPSRRQILALSRLTGFPWRFFYTPIENLPDRVFVCLRGSGGGLTISRPYIDHNGVLHDRSEIDDLPVEAEMDRGPWQPPLW